MYSIRRDTNDINNMIILLLTNPAVLRMIITVASSE